jgi:hypothetical protein
VSPQTKAEIQDELGRVESALWRATVPSEQLEGLLATKIALKWVLGESPMAPSLFCAAGEVAAIAAPLAGRKVTA